MSIIQQLFLEPEWALSQQPMRPKVEWAIDSEAMRARAIIVLIKSNQLVKNIQNKKNSQLKLDFNPFLPPKSPRFSLLVGYNIQPSSSSTNQNAAMITDHQLDFINGSYTMMAKPIRALELHYPMSQFLIVGNIPQNRSRIFSPTSSKYGKRRLVMKNQSRDWSRS